MQGEIKSYKKRLIKTIVVTFILILAIVYVAYRLTLYYSETQFLKATEHKYLSELDLYHDGIRKIALEKIEDKINIIESASTDKFLYGYLNSKKIEEATDILDQSLKLKNSFDYLIVLDNKANLITISGLSPESKNKVVHGNYSTRDYYKNTVSSKKTYISKIFFATGNYWAITISTPIFDPSGQIKYILIGSDKLENIAKDFNFKTRFSNLYSILVNRDGDLIIEGSETIKDKQNIAENDRFVRDFIKNNSQDKFGREINFKKEQTYVRGSIIKADSSKFYIFSYLSYSQFQQELNLLKKGINDLYSIVLVMTIAIFMICWFLTLTIACNFRNLIRKTT